MALKYFYLVRFEYLDGESISTFDLGIFSTKTNAIRKIQESACKPGFNQHPLENFEIVKFGVHFDDGQIDKSKVELYEVYHEYDEEDFVTNYIIFDYFSTIEKAEECINHLRYHSRIGRKHPNNFEIAEIKVDNYNSWSEGFTPIEECLC